MLFSCSEDYLPDYSLPENNTQLQMKSVAIYSEGFESGNGTIREFVSGDTIGLLLSEYHRGNPFLFITREPYWWQLSEPVFLNYEPVRLLAYYPYRHNNHAHLSVKEVEVEHVSQTDYMHGRDMHGYISRDKPYADIEMKHVLAMVQFKFNKNYYQHDCSVQRVSINNADGITHLKSKGILNLENGQISFVEGFYDQAFIIPDDMNFYEPYTSEEEYARILVMPMEPVKNYGDIFFDFIIDGNYYKWIVDVGTNWESGMKYTYEVEMTPNARMQKSSAETENVHVALTQIKKY